MIKYYCPHWSQKLGVPDNYAGHRVRCSKGSEPSLVPDPVAESDGLEFVEEPVASPSIRAAVPRQDAARSHSSAPSDSSVNLEDLESGPDMLTDSRTGRAVTSGLAFASTFSFFDLFLIPMALGVAFKTGAGRSELVSGTGLTGKTGVSQGMPNAFRSRICPC